jgi:hypothetical protein
MVALWLCVAQDLERGRDESSQKPQQRPSRPGVEFLGIQGSILVGIRRIEALFNDREIFV